MRNKKLNILLLFAVSCVAVYDTANLRDWAAMYNPGSQYLHPEFRIYHHSDSVSRIYIKIVPSELLYFPGKSYTEAKVRIYYHTMLNFASTQIIDSASSVITLRNQSVSNRFVTYLPVKMPLGSKRAIEIRISDLNRGISQSAAMVIDKRGSINDQDFLLLYEDLSPVFQYFVSAERSYRIETRFQVRYLYLKYFRYDFGYPKLPFENDDEEIVLTPDSVWQLTRSDSLRLFFPYKGFYMICPDSVTKRGLALINQGVDYPRTRSAAVLLEPLVYLTSKTEYQSFLQSGNEKTAVDSFWLMASPNADNARKLIMAYYNRVQLANFYFYSFEEGWKTDRGMIYTVFGPPSSVFRTDTSERWIYTKKSGNDALDFTFIKNDNPYSNNNFSLVRSQVYESSWFRAVNTWRAGLIFSIADEP